MSGGDFLVHKFRHPLSEADRLTLLAWAWEVAANACSCGEQPSIEQMIDGRWYATCSGCYDGEPGMPSGGTPAECVADWNLRIEENS